MSPKHGGCSNCGSRSDAILTSGLPAPDLAAKMKCYSVAVCSKCIYLVEIKDLEGQRKEITKKEKEKRQQATGILHSLGLGPLPRGRDRDGAGGQGEAEGSPRFREGGIGNGDHR